MAYTLASLRSAVQRRLGDPIEAVWDQTEINRYLVDGYQQLAHVARVFWDWVYAENLPGGMTVTQPWESLFLDAAEAFVYGVANYTCAFERTLLTQADRVGPGNHTSPFEATDGHLDDADADTSIPATSTVPETLTELARPVWDGRGIDALTTRTMRQLDHRYQETEGEVYGVLWEFDGVRTLRKVRVPAQQATTYTITGSGSWGILRDPTDLSTDDCTEVEESSCCSFTAVWMQRHVVGWWDFGWASHTSAFEDDLVSDDHTAANHTAPWEDTLGYVFRLITTLFTRTRGVPRRIPGEHVIGPERFGLPRRPYADGNNVRLEHWREGRALDAETAVCELPDRYALYLRDYAQARCLGRVGPGQDLELSAHFEARWQRGLARIAERLAVVVDQRAMVMGGATGTLGQRPPRPSLPWNYGVQVR